MELPAHVSMVLHDVPSPKNGKDFGYDDIEGGNLLGNLLGSLQEIFSGNKFLLAFEILMNLAGISHMLRSIPMITSFAVTFGFTETIMPSL